MGVRVIIDLVMDSQKYEGNAPSGREYMFFKGSPIEVDPKDNAYFQSPERDGLYFVAGASNDVEESIPVPLQVLTSEKMEMGKVDAPKPAKTERKSDTKKEEPETKPEPKPKPKAKTEYDLDRLNADEVIEDRMFKRNKTGPWKCPVCGKKNLQTKSGVRSHVGSKSCIKVAKAKRK